jgi:hemolysin activation/secretion protein
MEDERQGQTMTIESNNNKAHVMMLFKPCIRWMLVFLCVGFTGLSQASTKENTDPKFNVWEYVVDGNSLLGRGDIERTVYQFLGPDKSIEDIEKARSALEKTYHAKGFPTVFVDIPEQNVKGGVVVLNVTEGKVGRLRVSGSKYHSLKKIKQQVPALARGEVPYLPEVQQQMEDLNRRSSDRRVTPVLRAGKTPGTLEVDLKVKDELPLHGSFELNGRNSANTTRTRAVANLRYDNLWQKQHSASLTYQTSPEDTDEVQVWALTYARPIGEGHNRLAVYGVNSESNVASVGSTNVIGNGKIVGVRAIFPFEATRNYNHSVSLGVDYKKFDESVLLGADTIDTPISYLPWTARYDGTFSGEDYQFRFNVTGTWHFRDVGADDAEFTNKRIFAKSSFAHLRVNASYTHFFESGYRLMGNIKTQVASDPLISNEQFGAGGADSVRGYYESQVLGDHGIVGSLEVQTPHLAKAASSWLQELRALAFVDAAQLRVEDALAGQEDRFNLASAGIGMRLRAWKHFVSALDLAWPFRDQGDVRGGEKRLHFRLAYEF